MCPPGGKPPKSDSPAPPGGVMDVSAGRETAQKRQPGTRAGGKSRRRKKGASP